MPRRTLLPLPVLPVLMVLASCRQENPGARNGPPDPVAKLAAESLRSASRDPSSRTAATVDAGKDFLGHSAGIEGLWSGDLSDSLVAEIQSRFGAANLARWLGSKPDRLEAFYPFFFSELSLGGRPVGNLVSPFLAAEWPGQDPPGRLILTRDFVRALWDLPDSVLAGIAADFDRAGTGAGFTRAVLENALLARYVLEHYPQFSRGLEFVRRSFLRFDGENEGSLIRMTHGDSLGAFVSNHPGHLHFWIDRKEDGTDTLAEKLLLRLIDRRYPRSIRPHELKARAASLFQEPSVDHAAPSAGPVFFDPESFLDPPYPPDTSSLDIRRKLLRTYIVSSALALGFTPQGIPKEFQEGAEGRTWNSGYGGRFRVFEGEPLAKVLFHSGSRYFRKDLEYFGLYLDAADSNMAWEPIVLKPKMIIRGYSSETGIYAIGLQLEVEPGHARKIPLLYAGLPALSRGRSAPSGGRRAPRLTRKVEVIRDSGFCRKATESFAVPEGMRSIRGLFTLTFYRCNAEEGAALLSGNDLEGIPMDGAAQDQAFLFAVDSAQDTTLLYADYARSIWRDGKIAYSRVARCRFPVFLDADGDALPDLSVETASGQVLFLQQRDGSMAMALSNARSNPEDWNPRK